MDLLVSSQTFTLLNIDGYIRSGACRCTGKVKVFILMLNHVWEKGGSCVVFECHFVFPYIHTYIHTYMYISCLVPGPQVKCEGHTVEHIPPPCNA